jgi:hypothetical protein
MGEGLEQLARGCLYPFPETRTDEGRGEEPGELLERRGGRAPFQAGGPQLSLTSQTREATNAVGSELGCVTSLCTRPRPRPQPSLTYPSQAKGRAGG